MRDRIHFERMPKNKREEYLFAVILVGRGINEEINTLTGNAERGSMPLRGARKLKGLRYAEAILEHRRTTLRRLLKIPDTTVVQVPKKSSSGTLIFVNKIAKEAFEKARKMIQRERRLQRRISPPKRGKRRRR